MPNIEMMLKRVRYPASLPNWIRNNHRRTDETTRSLARFLLGQPRHALTVIYEVIADRVTFDLLDEDARKAVACIANPLVRKLGKEILDAILPVIASGKLRGIQTYHGMTSHYPIGRGIVIPVKPTFVLLRDEVPTPVFVIGWARIPFSDFQKRLFSTIISEAILSQEGFEGADADIICVPRVGKFTRHVRQWKVSDYPVLTQDELREQFDRYGQAVDDVIPMVLEELAKRG